MTSPPSNLRDKRFRLGDALIDALANRIELGGKSKQVGPKDMDVLVHLAERQHLSDVVRTVDIADALWGEDTKSDNAVMRCIHNLRAALGDDTKAPEYIKTYFRKGYALLKEVEVDPPRAAPSRQASPDPAPENSAKHEQPPKRYLWPILFASLVVGLSLAFFLRSIWTPSAIPAAEPPYSLAILPLRSAGLAPPLEGFGESIAEELIFALGQTGDFELVSRATAFPLGKQDLDAIRIGEILGVEFVVDGRISQQGAEIRVVAQITETRFGRVIWGNSFTYDVSTVPLASSELANEVAKALHVVLSTKAQAVIDDAKNRDPQAYQEFLQANKILRGSRDTPSLLVAVERFTEALSRDSDFPGAQAGVCRAWVALYRVKQETQYFEQAQKSCLELSEAGPAMASAKIALGMMYREQGDHEASIDALNSVVNAFPQDVVALVELGDTYAAADRDDKALETFQKAVDLAPNDYDAQAALGIFYYRNREFEKARRRFVRAAALNPGSATPRNNVASSYYGLEEFDAAAREWRKSVEVRPTRAALTNLGMYHYYLGEFERAEDFQRQALRLAPTDHRALGRLAESLRFQPGREAESLAAYEEASQSALVRVGEAATDAKAFARLGNFRAHLGQLDQMTQAFAEAHRLSPDDGTIFYFEAVSWAVLKNIDETLRCLREATRLGFASRRIRDDPDIRALAGHPELQPFLTAQ